MKFSTLASRWLYDRPLLTINERAVIARFAQWLDERRSDETPACGCYTITNHLGDSRTNYCHTHATDEVRS